MTTLDPQLIIIVLGIVVILLIGWIIRLELRLNRLTKGTNKQNLETSLLEMQVHANDFKTFKEQILASLQHMEGRLRKSVQKVATVRFDPFKGSGHGGSQSFATAFLDESGNGVVISTIHTRERVGVFSKPIKNGTSEYELTPEEEAVIKEARNNEQ
jgi:hypothetical protein